MRSVITIILTLFLVVTTNKTTFSQTKDKTKFYKDAFEEQLQMLKGEKQLSFKRAVFITENAYHNGQLDYFSFCQEIAATTQKLNMLIKQRGLEKYKTAGNWAVFTFMNDSLPINNFKPYTYDFEDIAAEKDRTKMFVTKLMRTRSGNCHSLPFYYKIICEEIGAQAFIALAPNHSYIKHIDESGKWINVELTNGGFPRDQWIIQQMAITVEAIKNEVYMNPLTDKENIVLTMYDLASAYRSQYGYDEYVLKIANTGLLYFPKCMPLIMIKANCYLSFGLTELKKENPNKEFLKSNYKKYQNCISKIDSLGYKEMPREQYEEWVKSVEAEKQKRGIKTKK